MANQNNSASKHSQAYNLFIIALTVFSLLIMVMMLLPLDDDTLMLLQFYDVVICFIFMVDFFINLRASSPKSEYFVKQRGWLDLLGSIPGILAVSKFSALFRLARLSRLARLTRLLRGQGKEALIRDIVRYRSRYTTFITIFLTIVVLATASVLVLQFESGSAEANITNGWDALWYSIVTITTVGYGDFYPVSLWGRVTAVFIMVAGVGLIGVMASLLSGLLIGDQSEPEQEQVPDITTISALEQEVASLNLKLDEMQQLLKNIGANKSVEDDS
jgi:voltage-gated potassium channel